MWMIAEVRDTRKKKQQPPLIHREEKGKEKGRVEVPVMMMMVTYVELFHHAQWDGASARLAVVHLALDEKSVDRLVFCKHVSGARS
jgi:hypothetical protein